MSKFEIVKYPDKRLSSLCDVVNNIDGELRKILDEMLNVMVACEGIGLAAPQIGILKRFLVIGIQGLEPLKMINPVILNTSDEKIVYKEGCLSLPGIYEDVTRYRDIDIKYTNENGEVVEKHATGLLAICIQHEMDHLDGKIFIDRLSKLRRTFAIRKYIKLNTY